MNDWDNDPFFQYPRTLFSTSVGELSMPVMYYDCSQFMAFYRVDASRARPLVNPRFDLLTVAGKALVVAAFYEYRSSSIGPYNEVGLAVACVPKGQQQPALALPAMAVPLDKRTVGFSLMHLPVTTAVACAGGRELYSLPKFVTPIGFALKGRRFEGSVQHPDGGAPICTLAGRHGLGLPGPLLDLVLYEEHQGRIQRSLCNIRGGGRWCLPGSVRLRVGRKDHPMGQHLAELGLDGARPLSVVRSQTLQLRLNAGADLP